MERNKMTRSTSEQKTIPQTEAAAQPDALFLARLAVEEQRRFTRRLVAGLTAFLLLWLAGLLYFKQPSLTRWWEARTASPAETSPEAPVAAGNPQVDRLNRELTRLQQQLGEAVTQTLRMKLESLEDRIRLGRAGLQDLELIESIKKDIRLLARDLDEPASAAFNQSSTMAVPGAAQAETADLLKRFGRLETLFYFTLGSFALVTIAAGGYWFRYGIRLKRLDADLSQLRGQLQHPRHSA